MHYIKNTYETIILLMDTRDNMLQSPDYHVHVKHVIIIIKMNSTRIKNHNLLILYNKINTDSNLARSSRIFFYKMLSRNIHICHECNTYLTTKIENNEASVSLCGFLWFILKYMEVRNKYGDPIWRFIPTQCWPWWIVIL